MSFSAYDTEALRLLTTALAEALVTFRASKRTALTETETSDVTRKITANLMTAYDNGERAPAALARVALQGVAMAQPPSKTPRTPAVVRQSPESP